MKDDSPPWAIAEHLVLGLRTDRVRETRPVSESHGLFARSKRLHGATSRYRAPPFAVPSPVTVNVTPAASKRAMMALRLRQ